MGWPHASQVCCDTPVGLNVAEKLQIIEDFIFPVQVYVFLDIVIFENLQLILGKKT